MNGILIINKEKGFTSHDVVAKLRGILHTKKIGHTGTLDPDAVGVLPVCIGRATKVCSLLTDTDKTYEAVIRFGVITDTLDMTGQILEKRPVQVTKEQLVEALAAFVGEIEQLPPMYSAVKVNGKRLYELARKGQEVERKKRRITIHELTLLSEKLEEALCSIRVICSKGTYIRSLCADIGERLGCGAAMQSLIRTKAGGFSIGQARTLSEVEALCRTQKPEDFLLPVDTVFMQYRSILVKGRAMHFLLNGNPIAASLVAINAPRDNVPEDNVPKDGEMVRVYGEDGSFYAIYRYEKESERYRVVKMLHD